MRSIKLLQLTTAALVAATVSVPAMADHDDYEDRARVISVTPQVERVNTPRQECRTEYERTSYYENRERSNTGAIIGGVAGGLLGSQIGRGTGRIAGAAVGAGLGAIVGDRVDNNNRYYGGGTRYETRPVERCVAVDNWQTVNRGYLVNYEYNGRQYSTVMDRDPGRFIPVNVAVRPGGYVSNVTYIERHDDREDWNRGRGHGWGHKKHHDRHYW